MKTRTAKPRSAAESLLLMSPLMGAAAGDALGTTLEFSRPKALPWDFSAQYKHTTITGGGPFGVRIGQITDDTMMAAAIAGSLTARGAFVPSDVARRYAAWVRVTFDKGGTCASACSILGDCLGRAKEGMEGALLRAVSPSFNSRANGALMRATPLAVFRFRNRRAVLRHAMLDAMLSHKSPHCIIQNAAYCVSIAAALVTRSSGVTSIPLVLSAALKGAKWAVREAAEVLRDGFDFTADQIAEAVWDTLTDLSLGQADDPVLYGENGDNVNITGSTGYCRVGFRMAWWEAFHAASYTAGIVDCVNRGGDADTNGAIVGGFLGAVFGIGGRKGIPTGWVQLVLTAKTRQGGTLDTEFHPKVFEAFVESCPVR